jgi:hypothetical protein
MGESELDRIWKDQEEFNRQLREPPTTLEERVAQTKELALHHISETIEMVNAAGAWKSHRRQVIPENRAHVREEIIDQFKYLISLAQVWSITPDEFLSDYWWKSMAVRQRFSEEWVNQIVGPSVVIDIDNVLADYIEGFCHFMERVGEGDRAEYIRRIRPYRIQEEIPSDLWKRLKHQFRVEGWKRYLPVMPGAKEFLTWCRNQGYYVVLLTSRPIDRYPNLYMDTLYWLNTAGLPFDTVWWTQHKGEALSERLDLSDVQFAVDDDFEFVTQFKDKGVRTYWLNRTLVDPDVGVLTVRTLADVIQKEQEHEFQRQRA